MRHARPGFIVGFCVVLVMSLTQCGSFDDSSGMPAERSRLLGVDRLTGRTRWAFATDGPGELAASDAVHGRIAIRSRDGDLIMLNANTGKRLWDVQLDDRAASRPAIAGSTVVMLTRDQTLRAYDVRTGRVRWKVRSAVDGRRPRRRGPDLPSDFDVRDSFGVATAGNSVFAIGRASTEVRAFDLAEGAPRWTAAMPVAAASIPVIAGDLVVVRDRRFAINAFAVADGSARWQMNPKGSACDRKIRELIRTSSTSAPDTASSTTFPWRCLELRFDAASSPTDVPPPVAAQSVVVDFGRVPGVSVVDAASGTWLWNAGFAFVAPGSRGVVVGRGSRGVAARDERTGAMRWRRRIPRSFEMIVTGDVVVGSYEGTVVGLDLMTGAQRWRHKFGGPQASPLATSGNIVVFSQ